MNNILFVHNAGRFSLFMRILLELSDNFLFIMQTIFNVTKPKILKYFDAAQPECDSQCTNLYVMNFVSFSRVLKSALAVIYLSLM